MSSLLKKIKGLYSKLGITKISYERSGIRPKRDWNTLLILSCLILLLIALFAFYFYSQINQGKLFVVARDNTGREVKINDKLFQKIISEIKEREESLQSIKQNKGIPADPSL